MCKLKVKCALLQDHLHTCTLKSPAIHKFALIFTQICRNRYIRVVYGTDHSGKSYEKKEERGKVKKNSHHISLHYL